jgi:hypothetical protein
MFGIPIDGPTNVYCDNEAVTKNSFFLESTLKKKHNSIAYHCTQEAVAAGTIQVTKEDGKTNLATYSQNFYPSSNKGFSLQLIHLLTLGQGYPYGKPSYCLPPGHVIHVAYLHPGLTYEHHVDVYLCSVQGD